MNLLDNLFCPEQLNRSMSHNDMYLEADQDTQPPPESNSLFFSSYNPAGGALVAQNSRTPEPVNMRSITYETIPTKCSQNNSCKTIQHVRVNASPGLPTNIKTRPLVHPNNFQNGKFNFSQYGPYSIG